MVMFHSFLYVYQRVTVAFSGAVFLPSTVCHHQLALPCGFSEARSARQAPADALADWTWDGTGPTNDIMEIYLPTNSNTLFIYIYIIYIYIIYIYHIYIYHIYIYLFIYFSQPWFHAGIGICVKPWACGSDLFSKLAAACTVE